jgi:hypothetical protein
LQGQKDLFKRKAFASFRAKTLHLSIERLPALWKIRIVTMLEFARIKGFGQICEAAPRK